MNFRCRPYLFSCLLASLWVVGDARAVLFYDTPDPSYNTSAPTSLFANSGWQYEGVYGSFLATAIAPQYFITAQHIGLQGSTFVSSGIFNGTGDVTYHVDTSANGGQGYWDIAGTDFRIFKISESFSQWAQLYSGTGEVGSTIVTNGLGGPRGTAVTVDLGLGPQVAGWKLNGSDVTARWGTNVISGIVPDALSPVGTLLTADFNALPGTSEAFLSPGDSGGGVFIKEGGVWKLAGVNYGVEGLFDTNATTGDGSEFSAALFNKAGLYEGSDAAGWTYQTPTGVNQPSKFYVSRISDSSAPISAIAVVPEPGSGVLILCACYLLASKHRVSRRRAVT